MSMPSFAAGASRMFSQLVILSLLLSTSTMTLVAGNTTPWSDNSSSGNSNTSSNSSHSSSHNNLFNNDDHEVNVLPSASSRSNLNKQTGNRIIGGSTAPSGRYPYSVSLQSGGHFCGGSLIGRDVILTAAHCMGRSFIVRIGSDRTSSGTFYRTKRIVIHPKYNDSNDVYDIALVFLANSVDESVDYLRVNGDSNFPEEGTEVVAMGWGDTDPRESSNYPTNLQSVDLETISNEECDDAKKGGDSYKGWIYDSMLCTWTKNKDACQGDSGKILFDDGLFVCSIMILQMVFEYFFISCKCLCV